MKCIEWQIDGTSCEGIERGKGWSGKGDGNTVCNVMHSEFTVQCVARTDVFS